jgi:hypothetical protein
MNPNAYPPEHLDVLERRLRHGEWISPAEVEWLITVARLWFYDRVVDPRPFGESPK